MDNLLRAADCKHRASDGNSKFCILLKISRFKALDERLRLVKKSVKYVKRFSRYPIFYCCHGNHFLAFLILRIFINFKGELYLS